MADGSGEIDRIEVQAIKTLATDLIEHEKLLQQVTNAASKSQDEVERNVIHRFLLEAQQKRYMVRAALKETIDLHEYKKRMRACGINVAKLKWIMFDEEEHEHDRVDLSIIQSGGYARKWLREILDLEAENATKSEAETSGIQEGVDYDFDDDDEDDDKKNGLIRKLKRFERDLYYMFHDFLKKIRDTRDPEGNAKVVYQEFKDCLKWLVSGVADNQVVKCSLMILNTIDKGIERAIGTSYKGKEIVSDTKSRRVDLIFDHFLRLIQHVSILWSDTNGADIKDDDLDALTTTADGLEAGFEDAKFIVKEWSDTLQCRHCSGSYHHS